MEIIDLLDDIIDSIQPEDIPSIYIVMAKVTDVHGTETIVRGSDLDLFLKKPKADIVEVRFVLDVQKIKIAILNEVKLFFKRVDKKILKGLN